MEIEDALKGNLKFCINDLDVANKMMRILSEAKQIHYETLAMLDTLIKDGNIQPNEISLLNKNMLNLKKYIIDILEKVKEKIQIDDYTGINVNKPNTFTYVDGKEENKPRKK